MVCKSNEDDGFSSDMANFGASFRQARESKGISLDQIAAETRISARFLQAIENEEFQLLPGGIFNRGFVRTYAEKLGLDADQAVAIYERLTVRDPAEPPAPPTVRREKKSLHLYPVAIGGLVLLIVIFYVVTKESSNLAQTATVPAAAPPAAVPPPPASAPGVVQPAPPAVAPGSPTPSPEATTPPAAAPEPAPPTEALRADLEAREQTWIKVDADGKAVNPGELLEAGMTRHFGAQKSIDLTIGNASGVDLKINDMPSQDLGTSGRVRELHITPDTIKNFVK